MGIYDTPKPNKWPGIYLTIYYIRVQKKEEKKKEFLKPMLHVIAQLQQTKKAREKKKTTSELPWRRFLSSCVILSKTIHMAILGQFKMYMYKKVFSKEMAQISG